MNEQQVNRLISAMTVQSEAINRLAESNESLVAIIVSSMDEPGADDCEKSTLITYLSGKPVGR